ncbi:hypothetical protein [Rhodococcoides fascians]|uniref:hypothetical protein n=1 Tax=Rhodococcoides fascians TaxID=1828 RepID=UPI00050C9EB0|nr:hypothetical protein [Rhodococcus fascians]
MSASYGTLWAIIAKAISSKQSPEDAADAVMQWLENRGYRIVESNEYESLQGAHTDAMVNRDTANRADTKLDRLRQIHARNYGFPTVGSMRIPDSKPVVFCQSCQVEWPCTTIRIIDSESLLLHPQEGK